MEQQKQSWRAVVLSYYKIGAVQIFVKFTGQYLSWSLYFNKVAGFQPLNLMNAAQ